MHIKSIGLGMVLGVFLASGAGLIYETYGYMTASAPASAVAVAKPLLGFSVDPSWVKLGAPNYPGDTMTFSGEVVRTDAASRTVEVALKGKNSMGSHVTGSATLVMP